MKYITAVTAAAHSSVLPPLARLSREKRQDIPESSTKLTTMNIRARAAGGENISPRGNTP